MGPATSGMSRNGSTAAMSESGVALVARAASRRCRCVTLAEVRYCSTASANAARRSPDGGTARGSGGRSADATWGAGPAPEPVARSVRVVRSGGGTIMEETSGKDTRSRYTERQLAAAGEVALDLRHALNNPLAALMAEAQLLAMEPLQPEHRAAVDRIIDLCRRTVNLVRGLDAATRAANDA